MLLINLWCFSGQCNNFLVVVTSFQFFSTLTKMRVKRELINYSQSVEWKIMSISKKVLYCPQYTKKPNLPPLYYNNVKYYLEDRLKFFPFWCHSNEIILDVIISKWFIASCVMVCDAKINFMHIQFFWMQNKLIVL